MTRRQAFAAREARSRRLRRSLSPARSAVLVIGGMLLAALLTAPALLETAQRQPFGPARTAMVEVAEGVAATSSATRLDVPWRTLDAWVHPAGATPPVERPPVLVAPTPNPPEESPSASPAPSVAPTPSPSGQPPSSVPSATPSVEPSPSPSPSPEAEPAVVGTPRVPTAADPLRVWIAGDSMWERPGPKLVELLRATEVVDVVQLEFRYSTGMTRPDFFDWPAHAASQLAALDPEVVLFFVGPNDSQPLVQDGVAHAPLTDGFEAAYSARVRAMMELLAADTEQVLWIGLPIMRDAGFDQRMRALDAVYAETAATVEGVTHIPTRALFADPDGHYAEYLPGPDGSPLPMRNRDGVHLSDNGAARLAATLFERLDDRHQLTD